MFMPFLHSIFSVISQVLRSRGDDFFSLLSAIQSFSQVKSFRQAFVYLHDF